MLRNPAREGVIRASRHTAMPFFLRTLVPPAGGAQGRTYQKLCSRPRAKQSERWHAECVYLSMRPGGWLLNLNIQRGALALSAVGGCKNGSWSPLSRGMEPRDLKRDAPEPAAAKSSKR